VAFGPRSRVVGIDDAPFGARAGSRVMVVGVLMSGHRVHGVMTTRVVRDGLRATATLRTMLTTGRLANQAQAVVLDGVAVGGFNVIDLPALAQGIGAPVVAVMRRRPNLEAIRRALAKTRHADRRWRTMQRAGEIHEGDGVLFQVAGASVVEARGILAHASEDGGYPEALRIAHLIGGAVRTGASRGGA